MIITLPHYAEVINNYCIGYFGKSDQIITNLLELRKDAEQSLPGLKIYISCADEKTHLLSGHDNIVPKSQLDKNLNKMAYFREVTTENSDEFFKEYFTSA